MARCRPRKPFKAGIRHSTIAWWLSSAGYTRGEIMLQLRLSGGMFDKAMQQPYKHLTIDRVFNLGVMLPDRSMDEILTAIARHYLTVEDREREHWFKISA